MNESKFLRVLVLFMLYFSVLGFATTVVVVTTGTDGNATWINASRATNWLLNISLNNSIVVNGTSYVQWFNQTNASTNVTAVPIATVNTTAGNWTWWMFNLSDGVHRFVFNITTNLTGSALTVNSTNISRTIFVDTQAPNLTIDFPVAGTDYTERVSVTSVDLNFTAGENANKIRDTCYYNLNNAGTNTTISNASLAICANITNGLSVVAGTNTLNVSVNDSAGNINST